MLKKVKFKRLKNDYLTHERHPNITFIGFEDNFKKELVVNNEFTIYFVAICLNDSEDTYFSVVLDFKNSANVLSFITFDDKLLKSEEEFSESWDEFNKIIQILLSQEAYDTEKSYIVFQKSLFSMLSQINPSSMSGSVDRDDFTKVYNLR